MTSAVLKPGLAKLPAAGGGASPHTQDAASLDSSKVHMEDSTVTSDRNDQHDTDTSPFSVNTVGLRLQEKSYLPRPSIRPAAPRRASSKDGHIVEAERRFAENLKKRWEDTKEHRIRIRDLLNQVREARSRIQDSLEQQNEADRAVFVAIRTLVGRDGPAGLERKFKAAEEAHSVYQSSLAMLEDLIDDLEDAELQWELSDARFSRQLAWDDQMSSDSDDDDVRRASRSSLLGISHHHFDHPEHFHPLYEDLLDAFAELQLAKERLDNLNIKRRALDAREDDELSRDAADFLESFSDAENKANEEVKQWKSQFDHLQSECSKKGLIPDSTPFHKGPDGYQPWLDEEITLGEDESEDTAFDDEQHNVVRHSFRVILVNPRHILANPFPLTATAALRSAALLPKTDPRREKALDDAKHEYGIETLMEDISPDKTDFVNRWLLQKLRLSVVEALVLLSTFRRILTIFDFEQWQRDVLRFWTCDGAGLSSPQEDDHSSNSPLTSHQTATSTSDDERRGKSSQTRELPVDLMEIGSWDDGSSVKSRDGITHHTSNGEAISYSSKLPMS